MAKSYIARMRASGDQRGNKIQAQTKICRKTALLGRRDKVARNRQGKSQSMKNDILPYINIEKMKGMISDVDKVTKRRRSQAAKS